MISSLLSRHGAGKLPDHRAEWLAAPARADRGAIAGGLLLSDQQLDWPTPCELQSIAWIAQGPSKDGHRVVYGDYILCPLLES